MYIGNIICKISGLIRPLIVSSNYLSNIDELYVLYKVWIMCESLDAISHRPCLFLVRNFPDFIPQPDHFLVDVLHGVLVGGHLLPLWLVQGVVFVCYFHDLVPGLIPSHRIQGLVPGHHGSWVFRWWIPCPWLEWGWRSRWSELGLFNGVGELRWILDPWIVMSVSIIEQLLFGWFGEPSMCRWLAWWIDGHALAPICCVLPGGYQWLVSPSHCLAVSQFLVEIYAEEEKDRHDPTGHHFTPKPEFCSCSVLVFLWLDGHVQHRSAGGQRVSEFAIVDKSVGFWSSIPTSFYEGKADL